VTITTRKGFTLIELLVVIAVIGILAAIALISLTGLQRSARDSERKSNISDYATAISRYYQDNQFYPGSAAAGDNTVGAGGIFGAGSVLVAAPSYMPKVLVDASNGNTNCKATAGGANVACQYVYRASATTNTATGFTIYAVLEAPSGNNGVFYINDKGTRGNVGAVCTSWDSTAAGNPCN
jgi:type IV pilus assembly protein PilA